MAILTVGIAHTGRGYALPAGAYVRGYLRD